MTTKFSKRGKNPGAVDSWLDLLGFYRKNVAYDETCLFRAVSEQLFYTQIHHEEVRRQCIEHGKKNSKDFKHLIPRRRDWFDHLNKLSKHMMICSDMEVQLICHTYKTNVTLFDANDHKLQEFHYTTSTDKTVHLCKIGEDHYDAVYKRDQIITAGFCQSIVYGVLYETVFKIANVSSIVNNMLHDKQSSCPMYYAESNTFKDDISDEEDVINTTDSVQPVPNTILAPFPFKVAKALDPNMYRNIEYDTWLEIRRELRLGEWYYGDDKLIKGTRCLINIKGENLHCYIQELLKNGECMVYVTKFAERLTVKYTDLKREDDAKPWPLPYRFSRNVTPITLTTAAVPDSDRKCLRKRREKKRVQIAVDNNIQSEIKDANDVDINMNVNNFEGCPLLMKDGNDPSHTENPSDSTQSHNNNNDDETNLPECNHTQWHEMPNASEPLSWPEDSTSSQDMMYSPFVERVITSPVTPAPYQDPNSGGQMFINYGPEIQWSAVPNVWPNPQYIISPDPGLSLSEDEYSPTSDPGRITQKYMYYPTDSAYGSTTYLPSIPPPPPPAAPPALTFAIGDKTICSAPVTPASPRVDMYPFMYPVQPPTTPLYYTNTAPPTPATTPRPPEYFIPTPSPVPIYSPTVELQYVNSPTYIYPPHTPPVTWYPPNVNSQGFIFPPPLNNSNAPNYM